MTKPLVQSKRKGKASKLTAADVRTAREIYAKGTQSGRELAAFYGVNAETMRRALRGETWAELPDTDLRTEQEIEAEGDAVMARVLEGIRKEKEKREAGNKMLEELEGTKPGGPYDWLRRKP